MSLNDNVGFHGDILYHHGRGVRGVAGKANSIPTPLVMLLALIPGFGAGNYLAAHRLRHKLLVRLVLEQLA